MSVMGPLDFILYTGPLSDTIKAHQGIQRIMYADDTQLYVIMKSSEVASGMSKLEQCISSVKSWATRNHLKFHGAKMELIHVMPSFRKSSELPKFEGDGAVVKPSEPRRTFGLKWTDTTA